MNWLSFYDLLNEWSEVIAAVVGGTLTYWVGCFRRKLKKMKCRCKKDDVQSKIAVKVGGCRYSNVYLKEFELKNTTNRDYKIFKVIFTFDSSAKVIECHSESKDGRDCQRVAGHKEQRNKVVATVRNMNRKDVIKYWIRLGDVTENKCSVTESDCVGLRVVLK